MRLLRARLGQDRIQFALVWEGDTGFAKVFTDLLGFSRWRCAISCANACNAFWCGSKP